MQLAYVHECTCQCIATMYTEHLAGLIRLNGLFILFIEEEEPCVFIHITFTSLIINLILGTGLLAPGALDP